MTVRTFLQGGATGDTMPPVVAITSPSEGSLLTAKQRIDVEASDNVGVARVEIFVDGAILATDTTAPYGVTWNTRRASRGTHVIRVIAYDRQGNSSSTQISVYK